MTIVGGVITSTLLTFFMVPPVFWPFERRRQTPKAEGQVTGALALGD